MIVALTLCAHAQDNPQENAATPPANQTQTKADETVPVTVIGPVSIEREKTVEPDWNQPKCSSAQSHDEADLCQQRRMAEAAENTVTLGQWQIGIGVLTLLGLGLTVYYTRSTAKAAIAAAMATQQSVDAVANTERAYVFFWDIEWDKKEVLSRRLESGGSFKKSFINKPSGGVVYKNCGRTPAIVAKIRLSYGIFDQPPDPRTAPEKDLPSGAVISADSAWPRGKVDVTSNMVKLAKEKNSKIYLYGEITYRDIFKNEHRSWFCRRWTGRQFTLGDLTDEKLNGHT